MGKGNKKLRSISGHHMTMMATTSIFGSPEPIPTLLCKQHWGLGPIIVCSNNDLVLTLTYFNLNSVRSYEISYYRNVDGAL